MKHYWWKKHFRDKIQNQFLWKSSKAILAGKFNRGRRFRQVPCISYTLSPAYSGFTITSQTGAELLEFRITLEYLGSWISRQRRCRGNFKLPKTHEIELFREVKYYCKNSIFPRRCFGRFERWRERQVLKGLAQLEWIFKELIAFLFTFAASQHRNLKSFWGHKFWGIQVTKDTL